MVRYGLCCVFKSQDIKFRTTTASAISRLSRDAALVKLSNICLTNAFALEKAIDYCSNNGIRCFRVTSRFWPLKTHPEHGYDIADLPESDKILDQLNVCFNKRQKYSLRLCFHPDQFVVLNSFKSNVVQSSINEIEYQAEVADLIGADVINIHGGGAYGDKRKALRVFSANINFLSVTARKKLTLENDDKTYTPYDLLPICFDNHIPFVYDVHHHRCNPDGTTEEYVTKIACQTWDQCSDFRYSEPLFHISSPIQGWNGPKPRQHHDYINVNDFPECWKNKIITVEVEAKAKEEAVTKLMEEVE